MSDFVSAWVGSISVNTYNDGDTFHRPTDLLLIIRVNRCEDRIWDNFNLQRVSNWSRSSIHHNGVVDTREQVQNWSTDT